MKTIAISIDEATLGALDRLVQGHIKPGSQRGARARGCSRSLLVRRALAEFIANRERAEREDKERDIFAKHRSKLRREAKALLAEQAEP
jgi:metal-responsive CopG/Arc/MetJ family transcriptional regulator